MDSTEVITQMRSELGVLGRYGVDRIVVFGSCATGKPRADRDIDILVRFAEDAKSFASFMDVKSHLGAIFPGRRVDLVLEDTLKPSLRDNVLRETLSSIIRTSNGVSDPVAGSSAAGGRKD